LTERTSSRCVCYVVASFFLSPYADDNVFNAFVYYAEQFCDAISYSMAVCYLYVLSALTDTLELYILL